MLAAIIGDERRCTMSDIAEVRGMNERIEERLLKAEKLAEILDCSVAVIRRWTIEGCPTVRLGRLRRYRLNALLEWLEKREESRAA